LESFEFTPCYDVDFIFNADNFNGKDILEIAELKSLWGQGVDEPYIALTNVRVSKGNTILMSPDKSPTIKIKLPNGVELIKFKATQEEYNSLTSEGYLVLDIVGRCESNSWGGRMTPQILIDDYEITNAV
jgi:single-stranded DNA-specific DHH superfamily exonuclease